MEKIHEGDARRDSVLAWLAVVLGALLASIGAEASGLVTTSFVGPGVVNVHEARSEKHSQGITPRVSQEIGVGHLEQ